MLDRITIEDVKTSRCARISFTLLKPSAWSQRGSDDWLAISPPQPRSAHLALLMQAHDSPAGRLLDQEAGVAQYIRHTFPNLVDWELPPDDQDDDADDVELHAFHGRLDGHPGRYAAIVTSQRIEDVHFTFVAWALDEDFAQLQDLFLVVMHSFQPMAQSR